MIQSYSMTLDRFHSILLRIAIAGVLLVPSITLLYGDIHYQPQGFGLQNNSITRRIYTGYGIGVYRGSVSLGECRETWPQDFATPGIWFARDSAPVGEGWDVFCDGRIAVERDSSFTYLGFGSYSWRNGADYVFTTSGLMLPLWFVVCVLNIPAFIFIWLALRSIMRNRRRRRRIGRNQCANCGYDLRATPDCCPECGARPPK